jgi:hypothetical protein
MVISAIYARMLEAMNTPPQMRNGEWAHERCADSRKLHEAIWETRPDPEFVRDEVIPFLRDVMSAVLAVPRKGRYRTHIAKFARNIGLRARNLCNFVDGKPSDFVPSSMLEAKIPANIPPEVQIRRIMKAILPSGFTESPRASV